MGSIAGKLGFKNILVFVIPGLLAAIGIIATVAWILSLKFRSLIPPGTVAQAAVTAAVLAIGLLLGIFSQSATRTLDVALMRRSTRGPLFDVWPAFEGRLRIALRSKFDFELPPLRYAADLIGIYYLCKPALRENHPKLHAKVERASMLRQIKRHSVLPVLTLMLAGGLWASSPNISFSAQMLSWGSASIFCPLIVLAFLDGVVSDRQREMREVFGAFIDAFYPQIPPLESNQRTMRRSPNAAHRSEKAA